MCSTPKNKTALKTRSTITTMSVGMSQATYSKMTQQANATYEKSNPDAEERISSRLHPTKLNPDQLYKLTPAKKRHWLTQASLSEIWQHLVKQIRIY